MPERKTNKSRVEVTIEQKLEYAKLMVVEGYSNKKVMEISGASESAVSRWKRQYAAELKGQTPEQQRIHKLSDSHKEAKGVMLICSCSDVI